MNSNSNHPSTPVNVKQSNGKPSHHRLSRRSSAELLRRSHPFSSSSNEEDSDGVRGNLREELVPPNLPPRRNHKRHSGHRSSDGSSIGEKTHEEVNVVLVVDLDSMLDAIQ